MSLREMVHQAADVIASKRETDPRLADALYAAATVAVKHRRPKDIAALGGMLGYAKGESVRGVGAAEQPAASSSVDLDKLRAGVHALKLDLDDATTLFSRYDEWRAGLGDWHDDLVITNASLARSSVQTASATLTAVASALSQSDPLGLLGSLDQQESASDGGEAVGSIPPQYQDIVQRVKNEVRAAAESLERFGNALLSAATPEGAFQQGQSIAQGLFDLAQRMQDDLERALEAFGFGATTSVIVFILIGLGALWAWKH